MNIVLNISKDKLAFFQERLTEAEKNLNHVYENNTRYRKFKNSLDGASQNIVYRLIEELNKKELLRKNFNPASWGNDYKVVQDTVRDTVVDYMNDILSSIGVIDPTVYPVPHNNPNEEYYREELRLIRLIVSLLIVGESATITLDSEIHSTFINNNACFF